MLGCNSQAQDLQAHYLLHLPHYLVPTFPVSWEEEEKCLLIPVFSYLWRLWEEELLNLISFPLCFHRFSTSHEFFYDLWNDSFLSYL